MAFYETIWFRLIIILAAILLTAGILYAIFKRKTAILLKKQEEDKRLINEMSLAFAKCVDVKDSYTNGHSFRVAKYTALFAERLGKSKEEVEKIFNIALLHDIGKIWEYDTSATGDAEFTASGVLFGHLYLGASLIKKYTEGKNYNREKVQLLIHMILSHHGTQEWGAVACPSIPEAFALHYIDNLDAKMYVCEEFYEQLDPGAISEKRPFGLDNRIYRPRYDV